MTWIFKPERKILVEQERLELLSKKTLAIIEKGYSLKFENSMASQDGEH